MLRSLVPIRLRRPRHRVPLERRLLGQEVFGYTVEDVVAATGMEAAQLQLPEGCIQLLG